jgi:hypothetical protein
MRTINGFTGTGVSGQGDDFADFSTCQFVSGGSTDQALNVTRTMWGGNHTSANSAFYEGVFTHQGVTGTPTTVGILPGKVARVYVTGYAPSGGAMFFDTVDFMLGGTPAVTQSNGVGSPAARTYTLSGANMQVTMASGTWNIQSTIHGFGMQV